MDVATLTQQIQYVLTPAVMISSAALFLLGFQNKFSSLAGRFRVLNHERRVLFLKRHRDEADNERLENLNSQIASLVRRAWQVKNVILLTYAAIVCFVVTSVLIFLNVYFKFVLYHVIVAVFIMGVLLLLAGAFLMMAEVALAFHIIKLESRSR